MEPAVLLIAILVISVLIYCVAKDFGNDLAELVEKQIEELKDELDQLMHRPDYDLPTYEGVEIRRKCSTIVYKLKVLHDML